MKATQESSQTDRAPTKGERTRDRILSAALALFAARGYDETSIRDIATQAGCAVGLVYRYFGRKEDLALALYEQLAADLEKRVARIPAGTVGERFAATMALKLRIIAPFEGPLRALFAASLVDKSAAGPVSSETSEVRRRVLAAFEICVRGATDAPAEVEPLARMLYAVHLVLIFAWMQRGGSRGARATTALANEIRHLLDFTVPMMSASAVKDRLSNLDQTIGLFFDSTTPEEP